MAPIDQARFDTRPAAPWFARTSERRLWHAACLAGLAARLILVVGRPFWHDEIYTLTRARDGFTALLRSLSEDTGPPLHYLVARLLVGSEPGPADVLIRLFSLLASVLHVPLLLSVARLLGRPEIGLRAAGLFALCPIAVHFASEGRGYALASLLVLAAIDRSLAVRTGASVRSVVAVGLSCAGAVLTHYMALFALVGLPWLLVRADGRGRRRLLAGWTLGAVLALPWLPVALAQPAAGLAWVERLPMRQRLSRLLLNVAFGVDRVPSVPLAIAAAALVGFVCVRLARVRGETRALGGMLVVGAAALTAGVLLRPEILIPARAVVCLLPLLMLALALSGRAAALGTAAAYALALSAQLPGALTRSHGQQLADFVLPWAEAGHPVCVAGIDGLELDYTLRRAGVRARVVPFPSDVARHPGWHDDSVPSDEVLRAEALALTQRPDRPQLYVLPYGKRASSALNERLRALGAESVGRSPRVELLSLKPSL